MSIKRSKRFIQGRKYLQLQYKRKPQGNNETVLVSLMSDNLATLFDVFCQNNQIELPMGMVRNDDSYLKFYLGLHHCHVYSSLSGLDQ